MFSWDIRKAIANFEKHGVPFEEAVTTFDDENGLDWIDLEHSGAEEKEAPGNVRFQPRSDNRIYDQEIEGWQRNNQAH